MRFFQKVPDGGAGSGVTAYFLVELKSMFSIGLLHFDKGTRDVFHSHAFNAVTYWIKGRVREHHVSGDSIDFQTGQVKYTPRSTFHQIEALEPTWALTIRGPWVDYWKELRNGKYFTLTHGRKEIPND